MRKRTPSAVETDILVESRRRCALCWGLSRDLGVKRGQIAHLDQDNQNSSPDNLAFLCLDHHDEYDSRRSQSKGFTVSEAKRYRAELRNHLKVLWQNLEIAAPVLVSEGALRLLRLFCSESKAGIMFNPQLWLNTLPERIGLSEEETEEAIDELVEGGFAEVDGTGSMLFPHNSLFWTFDPFFLDHDPAEDAVELARALVSARDEVLAADLQAQLAWSPRRLNPALNLLIESDLAKGRSWLGAGPYVYASCEQTARTRRFLKAAQSER